jgi:hypothetical protein
LDNRYVPDSRAVAGSSRNFLFVLVLESKRCRWSCHRTSEYSFHGDNVKVVVFVRVVGVVAMAEDACVERQAAGEGSSRFVTRHSDGLHELPLCV